VLEDDRHQPDQSMQLQLDSFLIKRYFSKLEPPMQDRLMELGRQRMNYVTKMMDLNFEMQNYSYDRVRSFIRTLVAVNCKRLAQADSIYEALKVNRFICVTWGEGLKMRREDLNELIQQAYTAEMQALRTIHHQTEIFEKQSDQAKRMLTSAAISRQMTEKSVTKQLEGSIKSLRMTDFYADSEQSFSFMSDAYPDFYEEQSSMESLQRFESMSHGLDYPRQLSQVGSFAGSNLLQDSLLQHRSDSDADAWLRK